MTPWTRLLRTLGAAAVAVSFVLAGGSGSFVLSDSPGDLYLANGQTVDEVLTSSQSIVNKLTVGSNPALLAFSNDGHRLYVSNGTSTVVAIDIATNNTSGTFTAPGKVVAMAYPSGQALYVAVEGSKKLSVLNFTGTGFVDGPSFKEAPDLLAASPLAPQLAVSKKGAGWISIFDPSDGKQIQVASGSNIGGAIADIAVARAEGYLWVATGAGAKRVSEVSLATGLLGTTAPLTAAPTKVTAMAHFAVAAVGKSLYQVVGNKATLWATAPATVTALAADQTGTVLYAATANAVLAYTSDNPKTARAQVPVAGGTSMTLAPVPNVGSSVAPASGSSTASGKPGSSGTGNGTTTGTAKPRKTHAPATDTISDVLGGGPGADLTTILLIGGALVVGVTVATHYVIKRLIKA